MDLPKAATMGASKAATMDAPKVATMDALKVATMDAPMPVTMHAPTAATMAATLMIDMVLAAFQDIPRRRQQGENTWILAAIGIHQTRITHLTLTGFHRTTTTGTTKTQPLGTFIPVNPPQAYQAPISEMPTCSRHRHTRLMRKHHITHWLLRHIAKGTLTLPHTVG